MSANLSPQQQHPLSSCVSANKLIVSVLTEKRTSVDLNNRVCSQFNREKVYKMQLASVLLHPESKYSMLFA